MSWDDLCKLVNFFVSVAFGLFLLYIPIHFIIKYW